jgi:hypothetical protein
MYKNRTTNIPTIDRNPQFFIRRSEIEFDERARFVEFVRNVWNEGRFGVSNTDPVILDWNDRPDPEPTAFYDMYDKGQIAPNRLVPAISPLSPSKTPLGRPGYQKVGAAFQRAMQMGLVDAGPAVRTSPAALTPNQGRGSPSVA